MKPICGWLKRARHADGKGADISLLVKDHAVADPLDERLLALDTALSRILDERPEIGARETALLCRVNNRGSGLGAEDFLLNCKEALVFFLCMAAPRNRPWRDRRGLKIGGSNRRQPH